MNMLKIITLGLMSLARLNIAIASTLKTASEDRIALLTFDGAADTTYKFQVANDPVMVWKFLINLMAVELLVNLLMVRILLLYISRVEYLGALFL